MAKTQEMLDLEARVVALEYLLKQALWNVVVARADIESIAGEPDDSPGQDLPLQTRLLSQAVSKELAGYVHPGLADAAQSDHFSSIVREHAQRVLRALSEELAENT